MYSFSITIYLITFAQISDAQFNCVDSGLNQLGMFGNGKRLTNGVLQRERLFSFRDCVRECWLQSRCKIITYHKKDMTCDIGGRLSVVINPTNQNYVTSEKTSWPQVMELAGACGSHNCKTTEKCVAMTGPTYFCIDLTCEPGWLTVEQRCFYISNNLHTWMDAQTDCVKRGGDLGRLNSDSKNNICAKELRNKHIRRAWIGANDIQVEDNWRWGEFGPDLGYFNWMPNKTSKSGQHRDCCNLLELGKWSNMFCQKKCSTSVKSN